MSQLTPEPTPQLAAEPPRRRSRGRTLGLLALLVLLLVLGIHLLGGRHHAPPEQLTVFLTADTLGHLEPCACRTDPSGGMTVRASLLRKQAEQPRLLVDAGNIVHGPYDFDLLKFDYLLDAMEVMGYDVANLGPKEVALDKKTLLDAVKRHPKLAFTSCNVLEADSRVPVVQPYVIKEISGFRVGFLGVVEDGLDLVGKDLIVIPPLEALSQWVPEVAKRCDYVVVLAFVDQETIKAIADRFYEVDAIFGGDVGESSRAPEQINRATVFSVTGEGKVLGKISFRRTAEGKLAASAGQSMKVEKGVAGDPAVLKVAEDFKAELRRRHVTLGPAEEKMEAIPTGEGTEDHYVGSAACAECHPDEYRVWQKSAHAFGQKTLAKSKHQHDPECLVCHATGYQTGDGFSSEEKTPELGMVACEACHGRGGRHVEAMPRGEKPAYSTFRVVTPSLCFACHDRENSPKFGYQAYWQRIAHGKKGRKP